MHRIFDVIVRTGRDQRERGLTAEAAGYDDSGQRETPSSFEEPKARAMPISLAADVYETLSAMITPAIFLTATGSLIISTSNRMSRVVDRIRVLNEQGDRICRGAAGLDFGAERLEQIDLEIAHLVSRGGRIRYALVALYLAFGSFVGTSLTLAIDVWIGSHRLVFLPTLMAVLGVSLMLAACVNLVREALEALLSNRQEVGFYRRLHELRKTKGPGCTPG